MLSYQMELAMCFTFASVYLQKNERHYWYPQTKLNLSEYTKLCLSNLIS